MHPSLYNRCVSLSPQWYHSHPPIPMYTRTQDHQDYPSPAPSDPSPGPHSNQQLDHHLNHGQIDSSIGPTRVTRRQASLKQGLLVRRVSLSINYMRPEDAAAPPVCPCPPYILCTHTH